MSTTEINKINKLKSLAYQLLDVAQSAYDDLDEDQRGSELGKYILATIKKAEEDLGQ